MTKNKYLAILVCLMILLCRGAESATGKDDIKNIETLKVDIDFDPKEEIKKKQEKQERLF